MEFRTQALIVGREAAPAWADQVVHDAKIGLLAVANASTVDDQGRGAVRMALKAVRAHVSRHEDVLRRFRFRPAPELRTEVLTVLKDAVQRAAQETYAFGRRYPGLTVTLDVVLCLEHEAFVSHIGDGRAYLVRRGLVHQLTTDHVHEDMLAAPDATTVKVTRALGAEPTARAESLCMELTSGDRLVLMAGPTYRASPETTLHDRLSDAALDALSEAIAAVTTGPVVAVAGELGAVQPPSRDHGAARLALIAPMGLFNHCTELELRQVAAATVPHRYSSGAELCRAGDPGTEIFLLIEGEVDIEGTEGVLATLTAGTAFGEMAMLDAPVRSATARARGSVEALVIPREAFFRLLRGNPPMAVKILWNMLLQLSGNLRTTSSHLADARQELARLQDELMRAQAD